VGYGREKSVRVWERSCEYAASDSLTNVLQTKHIMKMKEQKRKWDESRSPQWKYFQENERKEKRKERLDNVDKI
jgi:hypothetical protein